MSLKPQFGSGACSKVKRRLCYRPPDPRTVELDTTPRAVLAANSSTAVTGIKLEPAGRPRHPSGVPRKVRAPQGRAAGNAGPG